MSGVVVLHDLGAEDAGAPWRAVAPEGWHIPDLPGHRDAPPPRHGAYDPMGPLTLARWTLAGEGTVVGVGQNAHGALILAAGGGCGAAVIVDGLWGRWQEPDDAIDEMYASLRTMLDDPATTDPPPSAGLDPRTRHGYGVTMSAPFARRFWGAITCPVLAIETPASPTPPAERAERLSWFSGPAEVRELGSSQPGDVVDALVAWGP